MAKNNKEINNATYTNKKNKGNRLLLFLHVTNRCNLSCKYCYVSSKNCNDMLISTAVKAIQWAMKRVNKKVSIVFIGGEPLLRFDFIKEIVKYSRERGIINFAIATNGKLLDAEKINFILENKIVVTLHYLEPQKELYRIMDLLDKKKEVWSNRTIPDPMRIRFCITPSNLESISSNIRSILEHPAADRFMIDLMPAMSKDEWKGIAGDKQMTDRVKKEMTKIAEIFVENFKKARPFNFCIGECLPLAATAFLSNRPEATSFCKSGIEKVGISLDGGIYPCYIAAANPADNLELKMGTVFQGIKYPEVVHRFCGNKKNDCLSCLYWNNLINRSPDKPAEIYKVFHEAFKEADGFIRERIYQKNQWDIEQVKKFLFTLSEFSINRGTHVTQFIELINSSKEFFLERSIKMEGEKVYPARFNLWYQGSKKDKICSLNNIFDFFKKIKSTEGTVINYSLIKQLINRRINLEKIWKIAVGTDFRDKFGDSRIKFWIYTKDYPELNKLVLEMKNNFELSILHEDEDLLFGFDFYFDGRTNIKVYLPFDSSRIESLDKSEILKKYFSESELSIIKDCKEFYISSDKKNNLLFHFFPKNMNSFMESINSKKLCLMKNRLSKANIQIKGVSIRRSDLLKKSIQDINIYY